MGRVGAWAMDRMWLPERRVEVSPLLSGEGAAAFLGLSLAIETCSGHKQPLAEGSGAEQALLELCPQVS